jgi:predicted nucleic acid-binding protein
MRWAIAPDVNVLVAAFRADHPHHTTARIWLEQALTQAASGVRQTAAGAEWPRMRSLCLERQLSGNDLPDVWLAACVMHDGEHLVTFDRDFRGLLPKGQLTVLAAKP